MNKIALKNILIHNLNVHRDLPKLKIESFIYILENDYSFTITDIIKLLSLKNIYYIIKHDFLNYLINFKENHYYITENINIKTFETINENFNEIEILEIKEFLIKHKLINMIKFHDFSDYSFRHTL